MQCMGRGKAEDFRHCLQMLISNDWFHGIFCILAGNIFGPALPSRCRHLPSLDVVAAPVELAALQALDLAGGRGRGRGAVDSPLSPV